MTDTLATAAGALVGFVAVAYIALKRAHLFAEVKGKRK